MRKRCNCLSVLLIFWLAFCVSGCGTKEPPFVSPVAVVTTLSPADFSVTATSTPSALATGPETSVPTFVPTASATPNVPAPTLTALATLEAMVAQHPELRDDYAVTFACAFQPDACLSSSVGLSPGGSWAVFYATGTVPGRVGGGLRFMAVDATTQRQVYFSELYFDGSEGFTSDGGWVTVAHWPADEASVYVVPVSEADGGDFWLWRASAKLFRLDLQTGEWENTGMGSGYAFSPSGAALAYRSDDGLVVHWPLSGKEQCIQVDPRFKAYGRFTWSPDERQLVFVAAEWDAGDA